MAAGLTDALGSFAKPFGGFPTLGEDKQTHRDIEGRNSPESMLTTEAPSSLFESRLRFLIRGGRDATRETRTIGTWSKARDRHAVSRRVNKLLRQRMRTHLCANKRPSMCGKLHVLMWFLLHMVALGEHVYTWVYMDL